MRGAFLLLKLSLKRARMLLCITGLLLAGFQALRVHIATTPLPTLMRSVTAANAAMGTVASRTSRLSACQTASKPHCPLV